MNFWSSQPPESSRAALRELCVRHGHQGDLRALAQLSASVEGDSAAAASRRFAALLRSARMLGRDALMIATSQGQLAGYAVCGHFGRERLGTLGPAPEGWYLTQVVVAPPLRRTGVGSALVAKQLAWLARCTDRVYCCVNSSDEPSLALYESFGFREKARDVCIPGMDSARKGGVLLEVRLGRRNSGFM